jgi:hypothetical protein
LPSPANTLRDLTRGEPVIVFGDPQHPSPYVGAFNVVDCGQEGILLRFSFAVEEAQHRAISLKREGGIVTASLKKNVQILVGQGDASDR